MSVVVTNRPNGPVQIVKVAEKKAITTVATNFQTAHTTTPVMWGAYVESITAHVLVDDYSGAFTYKITGEYSVDGVTWTAFSGDVLSQQQITGTGNDIGTAYTTVTDFGLRLRFNLEVKGSTGGAGATLTVALAAVTRT